MDIDLSSPIRFLILCSGLDEMLTFRNLSIGGVELNPRVAWLISVNPLLYPLADFGFIVAAYTMNKVLSERNVDTWFLWAFAGLGRLLCFFYSLVH